MNSHFNCECPACPSVVVGHIKNDFQEQYGETLFIQENYRGTGEFKVTSLKSVLSISQPERLI